MPTLDDIERCLRGEKLYGDDFCAAEIEQWYADEAEAYANLGAKDRENYQYKYEQMNRVFGYHYLDNRQFAHVLGFGSAYGDELEPIARRIKRLTIVDPSEAFVSTEVHGIPCEYVKPAVDGSLPFDDGAFDLITCFGVLHHIPNVSYVMRELNRCLAPGGFALVREPIVSMGDWRKPRAGLTPHERGIPLRLFREMIGNSGFVVIHEQLCGFRLLARLFDLFGGDLYRSRLGTRLDGILASSMSWKQSYHPSGRLSKVQATAAYYVLQRRDRSE